jgi:GWxTD domain-containing protein
MWLYIAGAVSGFGQSIASLNLRYLYDPKNEIDFPMKLINEKSQLTVYFRLQLRYSQDAIKNYTVSWEKRDSYVQDNGTVLHTGDSLGLSGKISFPVPEKPWLLVAKVTNTSTNKRWFYYQVMESKYPVDGFLEGEDGIVFEPYVKAGQYVVRGVRPDKPLHVYFYRTDFSAASPPFADKESSVDRFLFADSTFSLNNGAKALLKSRGLYLVQQDTGAAEGFCFRVVGNAFPKFTKVIEIPAPLVFVCTMDEHNELIAAKDDKAKVDKVILDITRDTDRARSFMRNYFRQVELANLYFSTYKEGWKTDRGMLYLIFGAPDEVSRTGLNEIWTYKDKIKERFIFLRSGSIYDPQHYALLRNRRFQENWYNTIDNWRKRGV